MEKNRFYFWTPYLVGGGGQKNITSHYPLNMIGFGEKLIFLGHPTEWGGGGWRWGTKNITSHYPLNMIDFGEK